MRDAAFARSLRWQWEFGWLRAVKCWLRFGHEWRQSPFTDKHGDVFIEEDCTRCRIERHSFRLTVVWGIPLLWRVSFRLKHGNWPARRRIAA